MPTNIPITPIKQDRILFARGSSLLMPLVVGWSTIACVMVGAHLAEVHHSAVNTAASNVRHVERMRAAQDIADAYARGYAAGSRRMACPRRNQPEI